MPFTEKQEQSSSSRETAPGKSIMVCWSCKGPVETGALFCPTCEAVQPPGQVDYFDRLGLEVSFDLDVQDIERRYFDLQRRLHPDCFATKSPHERALSQRQAVSLNEAFEVLKDPLRRADHMIHINGTAVLPEGCNLINDTELLLETMEMREALAAAKTVQDVEKLSKRADNDIKDCIKQLSQYFIGNDLDCACKLTTRLKYLRKLAEEARMCRAKMTAG